MRSIGLAVLVVSALLILSASTDRALATDAGSVEAVENIEDTTTTVDSFQEDGSAAVVEFLEGEESFFEEREKVSENDYPQPRPNPRHLPPPPPPHHWI
ncbi:hypothetical protein MLD38_020089 [Melastoma candidum]|uniref:Uncharacterized protein n=1 Tax=Melastoma candidum TaxID=119954 RepID=A0ACB9QC51_9MYRT|nr:hypothetical protein MLD38_020089 [Melastoma candidum]